MTTSTPRNDAAQVVSPGLELVDSEGISIPIVGGTIRVGSGDICEIEVKNAPRLHSQIHNEAGVVWIETELDSPELIINGHPYRRLALRAGDVIRIADTEFTVRPNVPITAEELAAVHEDLSQLTAEELCDRILAEHTDVEEYEAAHRNGWVNLMTSLKAIQEAGEVSADEPHVDVVENAPSDVSDRFLKQIEELTELVHGQTVALAERETELAAAAALVQETQDQVARRLDELFAQFSDLPVPNEFRASA